MINVTKVGVIIKSSGAGFESDGVLNPAIIVEDNIVHIFYRAVAKGNYSTIGYAKLDGPIELIEHYDKPILFPQFEYESNGIEDPRIVNIDGVYHLSYTAYDGVNALGALAISTDLKTFTKQGLICSTILFADFKRLAECKTPLNEKYVRYNKRESIKTKYDKPVYLWIKNLVFFPRRIDGKICFLQRIKPDIQLVMVNQLSDLTPSYWDEYFQTFEDHIVMQPHFPHEVSFIGGGCPPIETKLGWLIIYHGVHDTPKGYMYSACAALLDLNNPGKEICRLPYPLFYPEFTFELLGEVDNVCFPTGTAIFNETLYIYYGAADDVIAVAHLNLPELLQELILNPTKHE